MTVSKIGSKRSVAFNHPDLPNRLGFDQINEHLLSTGLGRVVTLTMPPRASSFNWAHANVRKRGVKLFEFLSDHFLRAALFDTEKYEIRAAQLEASRLAWLEEPVWPPEDHAGLARVRAATTLPIAAGENTASVYKLAAMLRAGAVDICQPSVIKFGGIGRKAFLPRISF